MKKRIALLLGVLFIFILAFASCGQPDPTDKDMRLSANGETHTFKISLADFSDKEGRLFNEYSKEYSRKNDDGTVTKTTISCYKDDNISIDEAAIMVNADQLRPVDASGTYTMDIQREGSSIKLTTTQELYCQYKTEDLQSLGCLDNFKNSDCNYTAKEGNPFANNEGRITLRSKSVSTVLFANTDQLPISSEVSNEGYYIGKLAQEISNYSYKTTYDFDNKKILVSKNGGETEERELKVNCIDPAQLLLYIRSLDKSSAAFQDSPSVSVYDVTTDSFYSAAFALNRQFNLLLESNGQQTIVSVNAVSATVAGLPFIAQYNLSDLTSVGDGYDFIHVSNVKRPKYTTVKFRSGWFSYEIQPDETMRQTIDAVKFNNEAAQ